MIHTSSPTGITKRVYEMWDDGSRQFHHTLARMRKLGYSIKIIPLEMEYQQNQIIGSQTKIS